jgi:hypothetical protein
MTTSGTAAWNLDITDCIEEAYERAGLEARTGYDFRTARRSLNIMSAEWSNRGLNLWTIDQQSIPLVAGTATYTLPADTIDMIETIIRVNTQGTGLDYVVDRWGVGDYGSIPNKFTTGRPLKNYVQRTVVPQFTLWPIPDLPYTLIYWRMRRMQDASSGSDNMDVPVRFIPALVAGLAFYIAQKRPEVSGRIDQLKAEYEYQFMLASQEDRGRESAMFVPWIGNP